LIWRDWPNNFVEIKSIGRRRVKSVILDLMIRWSLMNFDNQ
jgi:hypothetical protein